MRKARDQVVQTWASSYNKVNITLSHFTLFVQKLVHKFFFVLVDPDSLKIHMRKT